MHATEGDHPAALRGGDRGRPSAAALVLAGTLFVGGSATAVIGAGMPVPAVPGGPAATAATAGTAGRGATVADSAAQPAGWPSAAVEVDAARGLLRARGDAVRTADRATWLSVTDPGSAFRSAQSTAFDGIRTLPLSRWDEEVAGVEPGAGPAAAGGFVVHVRLRYRLPGDTRDVQRDEYLAAAPRAGRWVFTGTDPRTQPALWDLGPLHVQRSRRALVIGIGDPPLDLPAIAATTDAAAGEVDAVWGTGGPRTAVVVVPANRAGMAAALDRPDATGLDQVAAVTSGELGPDGPDHLVGGAADRVVLNPGPFGRLTSLGRTVVLTHELAHVATRATERLAPPLWVEEGFANYVAYRDAGLPRGVVAADVAPLVRAGTAPEHLPSADDFDPAQGPIAPAYADAWLAFALMRATGGAQAPLAFYRAAAGLADPAAASSDQALQQAFRRVLGTSQTQFETAWRAFRRQVVGTGGRT